MKRTVARRAFAQELSDSTFTFQEQEDEKAPVFVLLPTGGKANRVFSVGTITERTIDTNSEWVTGTIADPTGAIRIDAGRYEPDYVKAKFDQLNPPEIVSITGKLRVYHSEGGAVQTKIRVSELSTASKAERDRWIVEAANRTIERVQSQVGQNEYTTKARQVYSYDLERFTDVALDAVLKIQEESNSTS